MGNDDDADRDNKMVACREAAEETCYALGAPRSLKVKYFDTGNAKQVFGGAWLIDMGRLSPEQQQQILDLHQRNKHGGFWRELTKCEREMEQLKWVDAREVLDTLDAADRNTHAIVPSLGSRFRRWTKAKWAYPAMAQNNDFRRFCLRKDKKRKMDHHNDSVNEADPVESKELEPNAKKPKIIIL